MTIQTKGQVHYALWEVTQQCNLTCIHCRADASPAKKDKRNIAGKDAEKLIDQLSEIGCPTLALTGGEPLLRKDIVDIVTYANSKKIKTRIQSNAQLLTELLADKLKKAGLFSYGVGLDGSGPAVNDKIRNKSGAFKKAIKAIKILKDHWLIGIGPGLFQPYYLDYQKYFPPYLEWAVPQPHNLFLAWWLQAGLLGLIGFLWLVIKFFKQTASIVRHHLFPTLSSTEERGQNELTTPTVSPSRVREGESKKGWVFAIKQPLTIFSMAVIIYFLVHGLVDATFWKNDLALIFWVIVLSS